MDNWHIIETVFNPEEQHHKETVFTIGNGYLGTRGSFEEGYPAEQAATLIHGVFDDIPIVVTELVNTPNWPDFHLFANGERFRIEPTLVTSYRRELNLRTGVLIRKIRWLAPGGGTLDLEIERFASLADPHILCVRYQVTSLDFSGDLEFRAGLPGHVHNAGWVHWEWIDQGRIGQQSAFLNLQTRATRISLCEACHLNVEGGRTTRYEYWDSNWSPTLVAFTAIAPGVQIIAEKIIAVFTSRDAVDPCDAATRGLAAAVEWGYPALFRDNEAAWDKEWEACNIVIEGDDTADTALRYNLFQLLIAAPRHDERVSIAAKSLSGFGYRGHVFWDTEIFILPFFIYTRPEIARNLLMYRYYTLPGARQKARASGYEGAMYAWESAATGEETTPRWAYGPESTELVRIWCGDIEHHITADVAYAVMHYWRVTGDDDFMREYGAEMILDTARFWGSRAEWNETSQRYEITDVIGPDEYHDHVDNNAYTNNLARWNLQTAFEVLEWLRQTDPKKAADLEVRLDLTKERFAHWKDVIDRLYLAFDPGTGLFEQFDGFFELKSVDLQNYEPRNKSMHVVLGLEGILEYQVIKQPDVLMLLYLLNQNYSPEIIKQNWEYYTPRTDLTFGSSLGPAIQAILAAHLREIESAYRLFMHAARTDLDNSRGNTADGIHAATAGGLWQAAVFGFGGLQTTAAGPAANPHLPAHWKALKFSIQYHGRQYKFDLQAVAETPHSIAQPSMVNSPDNSSRFPILGAIFDLDGVLTDTSEFHYQGWKRLADEEGIPFNRHDNEALRGIPRRESLLRLLKGQVYSEEQLQEMMARKNRYYQESIAELTPDDLLPGALELLVDLRKAGIKIAIGSASKNAKTVIEKLGIGDLVKAFSDGNSVTRQKPAPDLFLHAAGQLGLPPEQCVVFEDAEAGVAAALAGGMWVVGIGPQERVGTAHIVLPNLAGITWRELLERLDVFRTTRIMDQAIGSAS